MTIASTAEPSQSLLSALRRETSQVHHALHRHPLLVACQEQRLDRAGYTRMLAAFWTAWVTLVDGLAFVPVVGLTPRLALRADALRSDLSALGVDTTTLESSKSLAIRNQAQALGASYVLVGSSLGARQLCQSVASTLDDAPNAYLSVSPKAAGWPILVSYLRSLRAAGSSDALSMAKASFRSIEIELSRG